MPLWIINPGATSDGARWMLDEGVVGIGWRELPDVGAIDDRQALVAQYRCCFPDVRGARLARDVGQIFAFARQARPGDLVVLPLPFATPLAIGEITGDYTYRGDPALPFAHMRPVRWLEGDLTVGDLDGELRSALDTKLSFSRVQRRGIEEELRRSLDEGAADWRRSASSIEGLAREQILGRLEEQHRQGHLLSLVTTVLELRGLLRRAESDAAIVHGGEAQFVSAADPSVVRLHLAVCPIEVPIGVDSLRDFAERVSRGGAEQGLFVAWQGLAGGTNLDGAVVSVHVWTRDDVLEAMLAVYERLPRTLQNEIPLKRIWTLA